MATTVTNRTTQHSFNAPGTYSVSLTVTTADGDDTEVKSDYIEVAEGDVGLRISVVDVQGKTVRWNHALVPTHFSSNLNS